MNLDQSDRELRPQTCRKLLPKTSRSVFNEMVVYICVLTYFLDLIYPIRTSGDTGLFSTIRR